MKKISVVLLAFLIVTVLISCSRTTLSSNEGVTWIKYPGNPLNLGLSIVSDPWVIYDGQMFRMWYSGWTGPRFDIAQIYYATSSDGVNWNLFGVVLDRGELGSWDDYNVRRPVVLFDGTGYKMWYTGSKGPQLPYMVGYATSSNGINWTKYGANPVLVPGGNGGWDDWSFADFTVVFNGTHYIVWYGAQAYYAGTTRIGAAISLDGISWTKYSNNPVLVPGPSEWDNQHVFGGAVIMNGSCYQMWYSGKGYSNTARVGLATSSNGFSWSKYEGNPVLEPGPPESWDAEAVYSYCVIEKGDNLLMWYVGVPFEGLGHPQSVGLATSYAMAEVDIKPDTLNLRSNGKWISCYIELPNGYDVDEIDVSSVLLNGTVPVDPEAPTSIGDYDSDGIPDLMIKFSREEVVDYILSQVGAPAKFFNVTFTITGTVNGLPFEGSDTIKAIYTSRERLVE